MGKTPRQIASDYNACNFKCEFCYEVGEEKYNTRSLSFEDITRICDEADALGIWEIVLQGGEWLINVENTKKIIAACGNVLDGLQIDVDKVQTYEELPFLPVQLFKTHALKSVDDEEVFKTMTSSGTTGQAVCIEWWYAVRFRSGTEIFTKA